MSTRRSRSRSRLGCSQCKARRIKCDEGRPACRNCVRRKLNCSFLTYDPIPRPFVKKRDQAGEPSMSSNREGFVSCLTPPIFLDFLSQEDLLVHFPDVLRPRFKQLLDHFAVETSCTITHNDAARSAWCAAVPQLTAKHLFVLQGTMAISALHLSKFAVTERERRHFREIATYQMSTGLVKYRKTIANITAENAESLLAFSVTATAWVLLTTAEDLQNILHPSNTSEHGLERSDITDNLVRYTSKILRTLRGVLVILVPCWHLIVDGILSEVAKRDWWPYSIPASPEAVEDDKRLANLEKLWMRPDRPYEYKFDILKQALKALRDDFARISQLTIPDNKKRTRYGKLIDWTSVLNWPIALPLAFLELVESRQPEAWVILAHYAMLPAKVEHVFWLEDFGPNLISAAAHILGEEMWDSIRWPAEVVGVDLRTVSTSCLHASTIATQ